MLTRVLATASRSLRLTRNAVRHQSASASSPGVVELREYVLKPEFIGEYMKISTEGGDLRKRLVPLRLFGNPETGDTLNLAQHFYHYSDLTERQEARDAAQVDPDWQEYIGAIRPHVAVQKSTIYVEAPFVYEGSLELSGMSEEFVHSDGDKPGVYELRRFRVNPGGGSVLAFLDMFEDAAKLEVQNAADGSALKTVLVSEVGDGSEVLAVWRHGDVSGLEETRRNVAHDVSWIDYTNTIAALTTDFRTSIVKPAAFSNWK